MDSAVAIQPGEILAGKYKVERVLGQGGMGVVVSALHVHLGDRVAIKFLLDAASSRPDVVARFLREAQAAVKVKSEHVARVIDVGTLENGAPFMVMEYLTGQDLSQLIERSGPLPAATAVDYVLQACEAIAEAHSLGIVHRDLKPANLFLTTRADGSSLVKVLDFGISKQTMNDGQVELTATQGTLGSPAYMSPEQVRSAKKVDQRTDIWSLGVILMELVAGQHPFVAETLSAMMAAIVADPPKRLREVVPNASDVLDAAIARCLEKDLTKRFESVAELATALRPIAPASAQLSIDRIVRLGRPGSIADADVMAASLSATAIAGTGPGAGTIATWQTPPPPARGGKGPVVVGAVAVVALAAAAAFFFAQKSPAPVVEAPRSAAVAPGDSVVRVPEAAPPAASSAPEVAPAVPSVASAAPAASAATKGAAPTKTAPTAPPSKKPSSHADDRNW